MGFFKSTTGVAGVWALVSVTAVPGPGVGAGACVRVTVHVMAEVAVLQATGSGGSVTGMESVDGTAKVAAEEGGGAGGGGGGGGGKGVPENLRPRVMTES